MSKFTPIEFINSVRYYTGTHSPIDEEKKDKGYSLGWLHHRGRNPHHWEYWIDNFSKGGEPIEIPKKYMVEMICDWIGAGKAYLGKSWTRETPFEWFINKIKNNEIILHTKTFMRIYSILYLYKDGWKLKSAINLSLDDEYLYNFLHGVLRWEI